MDVDWPVTYSVEAQFVEKITNISAGGAYIQSHRPLWADTVIHMAFTLPGQSTPIPVKAKVMWVVETSIDDNGDIVPGGIGVQFLEVLEKDRKAIEDFVEKSDNKS